MTKQTKITATEARFPLASLTLSPINPRQTVPEGEVVELAESIWTVGLIQSIAGLADDNGGAEIVAGGRRLRALQYLAEKHPNLASIRPELANPLVMIAPDVETAETWANAENITRKNLTPAEEIRAYGKMDNAGAPAIGIARAFAVTEAHVHKRLKLAGLPGQVIDALEAKEISLGEAAAFTICDDTDLIVQVLEQARKGYLSEYQIKNMLKPDSVSATDRRAKYVGLDAYKAAGGRVSADLFAEKTLLDDEAILDQCFGDKLVTVARTMRQGDGWKWADFTLANNFGGHTINEMGCARIYAENGVLTEEQAERYDELGELAEAEVLDEPGQKELAELQSIIDGEYSLFQKDHAGIVLYVDSAGELNVIYGLVKPEDKEAAIEAGVLEASKHKSEAKAEAPTSSKPRMSQALVDDLNRVVTGARQHAAVNDPDLILALLAFQVSGGTRYGNPIGICANDVPNWPTTEADGYALDERLTTPTEWEDDAFDRDLAKEFRKFRKKGDDHIQAELNRHLAGLLSGGDKTLKTLIDKEVKTDIRAVWTPTFDNFFSRIAGPYLNDIWRTVLGLKEGNDQLNTFESLKVGDKRKKLHSLFNEPETREAMKLSKAVEKRIATWLPEGMG
ncbi:ParB/RepB/Spo0J family partition protein [Ruegeria sp. 2205SS24-7]|uniref:ParB/RepB/Spo0J family partition protein n=1 Tax=Ruegeria discodermiae TaxID=3064389 RepID=UPI0027404D97|nr:ParB/RepB/Spo0J family partition protein [Ruegeria sp. 2205SS24-7]MDP5218784.1 ParB/RepB/Spo0J family partition protein [Ruegeria sp. 2205SS24-7]